MSSSSNDAPSRQFGVLGRAWGAVSDVVTGRDWLYEQRRQEAERVRSIWGVDQNGAQTRSAAERLTVPATAPDLSRGVGEPSNDAPALPVAQEPNVTIAEARQALEVPFADKEQAKALGARWDRTARAWYAPAGIDHAPFEAWLPGKAQPVDPVEQFADALRRAGLQVERPEMDGKLHRVPVQGDRGKDRSGTYKGYLDGRPAGFIENFKTGERLNWKASGQPVGLSAEDRERLARDAAERQHERLQEREHGYEQAAAKADALWRGATPVQTHPYLIAKGVASHGLRVGAPGQTITVEDRDGKPREMSIAGHLLVPMWAAPAGEMTSLQFIRWDGRKMFMPGSQVDGGSFAIGAVRQPGPLLIAEGFSTAATVHELTGYPTVAAFNAGNIGKVAQACRELFPGRAIYIAGDNDHRREVEGKPNVGREKAEEAAAAIGGQALIPSFSPGADGSDWNDVARIEGREAAQLALGAGIRIAEREQMVAGMGATRLSERSRDREPAKERESADAELER